MNNPRYILAKYVPNLGRMEPRNVGVFLWHRGRLRARFLEPLQARFLVDKDNYSRWIQYWQKTIEGEMIIVPGQAPVSKKDESCLQTLLRAQKGEYLLVDGGFVPAKLSTRELPRTLDFLFQELVAPAGTISETAQTLADRCRGLFERTEIVKRGDFKMKYAVPCKTHGVERHFHFSCGLGNGKPNVLFQQVSLSKDLQVNSAAFMIEAVTKSGVIRSDRCAALVQRSELQATPRAEEGNELLGRLCRVIDVEAKEAADMLLQFAG